jgi:hypothetical protein
MKKTFAVASLIALLIVLASNVCVAGPSLSITDSAGNVIYSSEFNGFSFDATTGVAKVSVKATLAELRAAFCPASTNVTLDGVVIENVKSIAITTRAPPPPPPPECTQPAGAFPYIFWTTQRPSGPDQLVSFMGTQTTYFTDWICWCGLNSSNLAWCWQQYKQVNP